MAHDPAWHREYALLELAEGMAREALHTARRALDRKRPPAGAQASYDAALDALRAAGRARFDFEMAAAVIVDISALPVAEWAAALR